MYLQRWMRDMLITTTCTAPSKTFNIAGLQISNIWISNPELRARFQAEVTAAGYSQVNLMGTGGMPGSI